VFTDVPADVSEDVEVTVMRELMKWCTQNCTGRYAVVTADAGEQEGARQRLCIQFETEDDAKRFTERFG